MHMHNTHGLFHSQVVPPICMHPHVQGCAGPSVLIWYACALQAPSGFVRAATRLCMIMCLERGNAGFLLRCCMWFAVTR